MCCVLCVVCTISIVALCSDEEERSKSFASARGASGADVVDDAAAAQRAGGQKDAANQHRRRVAGSQASAARQGGNAAASSRRRLAHDEARRRAAAAASSNAATPTANAESDAAAAAAAQHERRKRRERRRRRRRRSGGAVALCGDAAGSALVWRRAQALRQPAPSGRRASHDPAKTAKRCVCFCCFSSFSCCVSFSLFQQCGLSGTRPSAPAASRASPARQKDGSASPRNRVKKNTHKNCVFFSSTKIFCFSLFADLLFLLAALLRLLRPGRRLRPPEAPDPRKADRQNARKPMKNGCETPSQKSKVKEKRNTGKKKNPFFILNVSVSFAAAIARGGDPNTTKDYTDSLRMLESFQSRLNAGDTSCRQELAAIRASFR